MQSKSLLLVAVSGPNRDIPRNLQIPPHRLSELEVLPSLCRFHSASPVAVTIPGASIGRQMCTPTAASPRHPSRQSLMREWGLECLHRGWLFPHLQRNHASHRSIPPDALRAGDVLSLHIAPVMSDPLP